MKRCSTIELWSPYVGGPPGLEPGTLHFNDVVPSAFVTIFLSAGDKIEETTPPELNQAGAGYEPAVWHVVSPAFAGRLI